ncbi:MAG: succinylglutamate desuccinylase/aspartoacylase family protein [Pseudomonadales bacterium]
MFRLIEIRSPKLTTTRPHKFGERGLLLCLFLVLNVISGHALSQTSENTEENRTTKQVPQAPSIDLQEPVVEPIIDPIPAVVDSIPVEPDQPKIDASIKVDVKPLLLLGNQVLPGTSTRLAWSPSQSFEGIAAPTPVLVVKGAKPGPILCLTAAVHGDELNGIETVRRVMYALEAKSLAGTVIGVPIVNLQGFHRGSRYLPDRRDLNRFFPGNPKGSSAARIAHSFFREVIRQCDALVDLHTGSFHRINLPQLRADLTQPEVVKLTQGFGATAVLHSVGAPGTLRRAATDNGIPAITLEAGGSMHLEEEAVSHGVKGIQTLINSLKMHKKVSLWGAPEPVYYHSVWVRVDHGGILFSKVKLGKRVNKDEVLGTVTNPITNVRREIIAPYKGRILGMAVNQVVQPGFAAYRIGIQQSEDEVKHPPRPLPETPELDTPDLATSEQGKQHVELSAPARSE